MVIGNGLIASVFSSYRDTNDVCIFASGVSNSKCEDVLEFQREITLLQTIPQNVKVIYFSTISVEYIDSPYTRHKLHMESEVLKNTESLVLRLPNLVGNSNNPNTLLNFLVSSIRRGVGFRVYDGVRRNLLDVEILPKIVYFLGGSTGVVSISSLYSFTVEDVVIALEDILGIKAKYEVVETGECCYHLELYNKKYLYDLLKKYFN